MKSKILFSFFLLLLISVSIFGQAKPQISFENLMISAEQDFSLISKARTLAESNDLPHTIYLPEGIFIEAKGTENNKVVYSIINDLLHPFNNGEVAFWEEIVQRYDLRSARIHWSNKPTQNPNLGFSKPVGFDPELTPRFIMVMESTNDACMTFRYDDGALLDSVFIPSDNPNLSTPIEPLLTPQGKILVSDQLTDNIVEFDTLGAFVRILFGGNTAVLDNCRGIELHPSDTMVVAAIAGGANQDAIAQFSLSTGSYLGNFIAPNSTQMDGPWDIIFRQADCLVTGQASNDVTRYDLNGNYLGVFVPTIAFPEQINKTLTTNIIVGNFSSPSGLYIYDENGTQLNYFNAVTGLRGCIQLGNGNYLVTNGTSVVVLDQTTGAVVATPVSGISGRSAHEFETSTPANTFQLSVDVANGWNLVSIPGNHPDGNTPDNWWPFRDPSANVFKYNNGYQAVDTLYPGIAYWMKHSGSRTYNTGDEWPAGGIITVPHLPLEGSAGWNGIGGYELVVTAGNVLTNPPGLQSGPIYKYSGGYSVAMTLDPGYGYWIKLTAAGQIIIPETLAKDGKPVEYFPENWGRIVITDAAGVSYTLYAVNGQVDLSQYELPPAPPAGMYDFRYSSGRIAEDLSSSVKTIEMSGVVYPLTVRVEGMDIRLMDQTGKTLNQNLKSGEEIVISDATIQKLMVSSQLVPTVYSLEQNYPNPFNPSTMIEFSLPEMANVKLSIYNALGEKVAELVNTSLQAGKYQYNWNVPQSGIATGMYIYELRTDNFVSVKKMLLLK